MPRDEVANALLRELADGYRNLEERLRKVEIANETNRVQLGIVVFFSALCSTAAFTYFWHLIVK